MTHRKLTIEISNEAINSLDVLVEHLTKKLNIEVNRSTVVSMALSELNENEFLKVL